MLHRATLRQCATKGGCRLQFNSVISSFTRLSELALARRARISLGLRGGPGSGSQAFFENNLKSRYFSHVKLTHLHNRNFSAEFHHASVTEYRILSANWS